ncbi:hypothetical protein [Synechococcus elongatus]|uniref:hypothetical protein n=1 Tax=Synechococcus elongatus TaxID=32046 RepID=UPI000F7F9923|nr:hypothetical protein [Synechococcus elongatus]
MTSFTKACIVLAAIASIANLIATVISFFHYGAIALALGPVWTYLVIERDLPLLYAGIGCLLATAGFTYGVMLLSRLFQPLRPVKTGVWIRPIEID